MTKTMYLAAIVAISFVTGIVASGDYASAKGGDDNPVTIVEQPKTLTLDFSAPNDGASVNWVDIEPAPVSVGNVTFGDIGTVIDVSEYRNVCLIFRDVDHANRISVIMGSGSLFTTVYSDNFPADIPCMEIEAPQMYVSFSDNDEWEGTDDIEVVAHLKS